MALLPTDQKDQIKVAVAVVAAALAALYYQYPHQQAQAELEASRARVERLETANARAARSAARGELTALRAEARRSRATLQVLRRLVPTEHEVPALLEQVSTAARRAGLELGGVTPEPVLRGDAFDTYRYKVTVVGGYHALTTFLANAGSLPRIVAPVTFTLLPAPTTSGAAAPVRAARTAARVTPLQAIVTIQTHVVRTAGATAPAAGAHATAASGGEVVP